MIEIRNILGPTTEAAIAQLEVTLGRKLPEDYRNFVLQCNGGVPLNSRFKRKMWADAPVEYDYSVEVFLGIEHGAVSDIRNAYYSLSFKMPFPAVPIAYCSLEELLVLSLDDDSFRTIYFVNQEEDADEYSEMEWDAPGVHKIADSFTSLLELLTPSENDFESRLQEALEWYTNGTGFPTDKRTAFPREKLIVSEASISAAIDLSSNNQNLRYTIDLFFEPLDFKKKELKCNMSLNDIPWAVKDWRELDGLTRKLDYGQDGYRGGFFTPEAAITHIQFLQLSERRGNTFKARLMVIAELDELFSENYSEVIYLEFPVSFKGLALAKDNFEKDELSVERVRTYLTDKVALASYDDEPEFSRVTPLALKPRIKLKPRT